MSLELAIVGCAATVGWVYAGYPVALAALATAASGYRTTPTPQAMRPEVTLVIPAFNEAAEIERKVANTFALTYPAQRLRVLWVTDGSTDGSQHQLRRLGMEVLHHPARRGKAAAIRRAMASVTSPFVVFTDANAMLRPDALEHLMAPFADPQVACVAGAKRVGDGGSGKGEGMYWRYEAQLKRLESQLHSTMGAAGELVALRTDAFPELDTDAVLDDFLLSMRPVLAGWRTVYAGDAVAFEAPSATASGDFERRARIAFGGLQAVGRLPGLLNPLQVGWAVAFCMLNHRVLRWTAAPAALFLLPVLLGWAALVAPSAPVLAMVAAQSLTFAAIAWAVAHPERSPRGLATLAHFYLANAAIVAGWWRFATRSQSVNWNRVQRAHIA